ncbi:hypothetical protein J1N35_044247 [Gossypium stocksii]|uniref:Uncharacterized protein n=1 Tax=Gossypium stocksii TaxID=47602 RepID=A0A9D3U947_9ROSI|nr:hypothetical protein J1N35_044247 [Gossypium stocksii]
MGCPFLSLRFSLFLSLSFATSSSPFSFFKLQSPSSSIPKATPSDLLSLLGTPSHSSSVNPSVADELKSCFKFLVPFNPINTRSSSDFKSPSSRRSLLKSPRDEQNELIWWPPEPVLELARLAFDSGGDPDSIHRTLDPTVMPVPDVDGSKEDKCELTRTPYGRRFISQELNSYLEYLFKLIVERGPLIVERGPDVGLKVSLNRYDLFHGHLFIATETGRLGILFHAKEYPLYDKQVFPYYLGYCQKDSNVTYDDSINLRNILWLAPLPSNSTQGWIAPGVLLVLDAHPGGIVYRDLIPEYVNVVRTIYEDDLGNVVVDVNYLNVGDSQPDYQIFIC